jgi:uncharacterized protein YcbX
VYAPAVVAVSLLCLTPVKGLKLLHPEEVELTAEGAAGNRCFYLVDAGGRLFSGIDHGPLCRVVASFDSRREHLELTFPDGKVVDGSAIADGDEMETDFYGRPVGGRVVEGPFGDALSGYVGKELRLVRPERPRGAYDIEPVTILSDASVEELRRRAGRAEALDGRRFRMLIHLTGCDPHEEDTWEGRLMRLGEALLRVGGPVARCATTTRDPETGVRDFDTLREVKAYRGLREGRKIDFGVYGEVVEPGRVRVGDPAELQ